MRIIYTIYICVCIHRNVTLPYKYLESVQVLVNFLQLGSIKLIKRDSKDIYNLAKDLYFKQMLIF